MCHSSLIKYAGMAQFSPNLLTWFGCIKQIFWTLIFWVRICQHSFYVSPVLQFAWIWTCFEKLICRFCFSASLEHLGSKNFMKTLLLIRDMKSWVRVRNFGVLYLLIQLEPFLFNLVHPISHLTKPFWFDVWLVGNAVEKCHFLVGGDARSILDLNRIAQPARCWRQLIPSLNDVVLLLFYRFGPLKKICAFLTEVLRAILTSLNLDRMIDKCFPLVLLMEWRWSISD